VGLSQRFHSDNGIKSLFNVLKYVAIQLSDTDGDVVLFCNKGRSRSPMYLVAYIVIIYNVTTCAAMHMVGQLLREQRGEQLDRFGCLKPIIDIINDIS